MKKYSAIGLRKGKTDKLDSIKIANYGIDNWFKLTDYEATDEVYSELNEETRVVMEATGQCRQLK